MSYMFKIIKYTIIHLEIVINIIFKQVLTVFSNVSARIWNVIPTNFDVNISFIGFWCLVVLGCQPGWLCVGPLQ